VQASIYHIMRESLEAIAREDSVAKSSEVENSRA